MQDQPRKKKQKTKRNRNPVQHLKDATLRRRARYLPSDSSPREAAGNKSNKEVEEKKKKGKKKHNLNGSEARSHNASRLISPQTPAVSAATYPLITAVVPPTTPSPTLLPPTPHTRIHCRNLPEKKITPPEINKCCTMQPEQSAEGREGCSESGARVKYSREIFCGNTASLDWNK